MLRFPRSVESLASVPQGAHIPLAKGEIHLWYTAFTEHWDPDLLARYRALMTEAERARCDRFLFERDRVQFAITRALVRGALSRYAHVAPHSWRFVENRYGKPAIDVERVERLGDADRHGRALADDVRDLYFNLSNTRGLVVCAITRTTPEIGVDTERLDRASSLLDIADRYFSPSEVKDLRAHPESEQRARFFVYWTLKESYIKARGMGLALPLEQFSFHLADDRPITISFDARMDDHPSSWYFWLGQLADSHYVAVGARIASGRALQLRARHWIPLAEP